MFVSEADHIIRPVSRELKIELAHHLDDVRDAQRLRFKIFSEEMGARLNTSEAGFDIDPFDHHCDHLLVRDQHSGRVVGTYRILRPEAARNMGQYYTETEFDLSRLTHLRPDMVELGRACVHQDYRNGATISLLWAGLADYMQTRGYQYLIGCASVGMGDGGHAAASLYTRIKDKYAAPVEWQVTPLNPLPLAALNCHVLTEVPALIKGYLRLGAYICGAPAWDPEFDTADLPILLPMSRLSPRYAKHFMAA